MSDYAFPPSFRATDADDNPLAGGTMRFYAAGTTTPKAVYSDAARTVTLGTQVSTNSAGVPVSGSNVPILIYYGTGNYKYALYDSDGVLVPGMEFDNIPGYVAEAAEVTTGLPTIPIVSKTAAFTVGIGDRSTLFNCNTTGGSFPGTLPSAVTVGNDFLIGFKHNGTANAFTMVATGSQVIRFQGNRTAFSLVGQGEVMWLLSDGSDWNCVFYAPPFRKATDPYFIVLDRLTAPPANPDAGARYLINGTPTGAWSTLGFADEDIVEADGNGSWIQHTPAEGWLAFDVDEKVSLVFKNGAWENFQVDPGESTLKTLIVQDQKSSNTDGGTPTLDAWTTAVLNTSVVNTITDASLASNEITLPAGRYRVKARKVFAATGESRIRFKTADSSDVVILSESVHAGNVISTNSANAIVGVTAMLDGEFEIAVSTDFVLQYYVNVNQHTTATQGLGIPSNISGAVETYATVIIEDIAAQQGPTGDQGAQGAAGPTGPIGIMPSTSWVLDPSTTDADPGAGELRFNNASPASATNIYIDNLNSGGVDVSAWIDTFDDAGISAGRGYLHLYDADNPTTIFYIYQVTGTITDGTGYRKIPVTYIAGSGSFASEIIVGWQQRGTSGSGDVTGPASSTANALATYSGTTGKILLNSTATWDGSSFLINRAVTGGAAALTLRRSFDPGGNHEVARLDFDGLDSGAVNTTIARISSTWSDRTDTSEDAVVTMHTIIAGTLAERFRLGHGFYVNAITGGDKGAGTINVNGLYQSGVPVWTSVVKTADETIQSDTTLGADAALVFAMLAATTYRFRAFIFFDTGGTGDFKWRHSGPASPTLVRIKRSHIIGAGTAYAGIAFDAAYSSGDIAIAGAAGTGWIEFEGIIVNGANAGNFEFQWAQNATEAVDTTVRAGSYIEYRVVA